jgi:hypothetical protein
MTAFTMAREVVPAKSITRTDVFAAQCSLNIACLATERLAAKAAAPDADLEGDLADLLSHLRSVASQLDRAMG